MHLLAERPLALTYSYMCRHTARRQPGDQQLEIKSRRRLSTGTMANTSPRPTQRSRLVLKFQPGSKGIGAGGGCGRVAIAALTACGRSDTMPTTAAATEETAASPMRRRLARPQSRCTARTAQGGRTQATRPSPVCARPGYQSSQHSSRAEAGGVAEAAPWLTAPARKTTNWRCHSKCHWASPQRGTMGTTLHPG